MTSDGIANEDWSVVETLAREVVDVAECPAKCKDAEDRMNLYLRVLEERYGPRPSILATKADYCDSVDTSISLLKQAYDIAIKTDDYCNMLLVASSLAEIYIDRLCSYTDGKKWLNTFSNALQLNWDDDEYEEYLRLEELVESLPH